MKDQSLFPVLSVFFRKSEARYKFGLKGLISMARLRIALLDHLRGTKTQVELPDEVPMNRLIPALVRRLGLPTEQDGQPVTYRLDNRETGQRIGDEQSLAEANVQDQTVLTLLPEVTAGGTNA